MNTKLRAGAKNGFERYFFKLMNDSVFGRTMENVRRHSDIKLVTTDKKRDLLISDPNYPATKMVFRKFVSNRNENNKSKNE